VGVFCRYYMRHVSLMTAAAIGVLWVLAVSILAVDLLLDVAADHLPISVLLSLVVAYMPDLLVKILPLCFALGIVLAVDRLSQRQELIAALSLGVTRFRQWCWCGAWGLFGSILCVGLTYWAPHLMQNVSKQLSILKLQSVISALEPYTLTELPGNRYALMTVTQKPNAKGQLRGAVVIFPAKDSDDSTKIWQANRASVAQHPNQLKWQLHHGQLIQIGGQARAHAVVSFDHLTESMSFKRNKPRHVLTEMHPESDAGSPVQYDAKAAQVLNLNTLSWSVLTQKSEKSLEAQVVWHQRFAPCVFIFVLSVLGLVTVPMTSRRQRWFQYLPLAGCFAFYHMSMLLGIYALRQGWVPGAWGLWPIHGLMCLITGILSIRWCFMLKRGG
jgi:lipopolysaccharide export LptBFGC system permease protein LptF